MLDSEAEIRLTAFLAIVLAMAALEWWLPRRGTVSRSRWPANITMVVIATILVRLLFPLGAVGAAAWASENGTGLLHHLDLHPLAAVPAALLVLDLAIYFQHRVFHAVPTLWRLHRVHHSDLEFDFTTALRFHPLEILLSMLIKAAIIIVIGAPVLAVMIFEIVLNATAVFNHANVRLPIPLDRVLRWFVVTPDMHRVHHSWHREETDSNFGFNLPWWDRLFRTYRAQPRDGHTTMTIGLAEFRDPSDQRLFTLLAQPAAPARPRPVR